MDDNLAAKRILASLKTKKSLFWEREREKNALALFHRAAVGVPAYKDFLKKNHINPAKIKTFADFQFVPPVDKKNYLRQYPLEKLVWPSALHSPLVWTATSGSTGEPFYFPRSQMLDKQYASILSWFLGNSTHSNKKGTLVIVGFGMGVWIGGLITYQAYEIVGRESNQSISILTPGINKKEIFNALRRLAPHFSQTILVGYAPFIKDILDSAKGEGVDLSKINLRLHFAAEAFTESFRDYLGNTAYIKDVCRDTINIYGSADIGAMAFETPLAILVRRLASKDKTRRLWNDLFGDISKTPTLAQYDPSYITFEASQGELLVTGDNSIPLVRYGIGDHGSVMSFNEVKGYIKGYDIPIQTPELPFVYVYERNDFSVTLYGLQVYPEHIREALIRPSITKFLTGKFTMTTKFDDNQDQYLELNLETARNVTIKSATKKIVLREVVATLKKMNSEFCELHKFMGDRALPRLVFWPTEDERYFRPGVKQKWVERQLIA